MTEVFAYTDGACSGNPGPGGWGALLVARKGGEVVKERELHGGEPGTTNNRMELMAAISALESLSRRSRVTVVTDSTYLKNGITSWIDNWKRRGWKTGSGTPVKNRDLWERLSGLRDAHDVTWQWTRGHRGHPENERADKLARTGMKPFLEGKKQCIQGDRNDRAN